MKGLSDWAGNYQSEDGVIANNTEDSGLLADADDTAKTILTMNLLGLRIKPDKMIAEFEGSSHFCTYKEERNESFSTNCNVLDALLHSLDPANYYPSILKVTSFLCKVWNSAGVKDKWVRFKLPKGLS